MRATSAYADRPRAVEMIETHISWVFLTDRDVYKLKKPVKFDFLDFSTPELRHSACQDELRLNRRLAADVYLDVLPIARTTDGTLELNGHGTPVDWVVHMRRLPADRSLDALLKTGRATPDDADAIARRLAEFYAHLPPAAIEPAAFRDALEHHIRANGDALFQSFAPEESRVRRIQSAQLRYIALEATLFARRVAEGRVVEGHGDLRPEHIYLDGSPIIIDCVEFSQELRTLDVADELSFLWMECERLGDGGVGQRVLAEYERASGDRVPPSLLAFYRAYRAMVRAKVALLREQQQPDAAEHPAAALVRRYLDLADRYAAELGPPLLLVVGGLMGSGKSTLAAKLADRFGAVLLSTDHVRRQLLGTSTAPADYGEGNYQPALRARVYDELFPAADRLLADRQSVILDGTFLIRALRTRAHDLARQRSAVALFIHCTCPRDVTLQRIEQRAARGQTESEARTELYDRQAREFEPPTADEPAVTVDTTQEVLAQLQTVIDIL